MTKRFIQFKDFCRKTGKEIADMIESVLQDSIYIVDCRGKQNQRSTGSHYEKKKKKKLWPHTHLAQPTR